MSGFVADPLWGRKALSYTIAAFAAPAWQAEAAPVLQAIADAAGAPQALHLTPAPALHVSLYSVTPVRLDFDKPAYWREHRETVLALLENWCRSRPPGSLRFRELRALPAAVVAVAARNDAVWELRQQLAEALPPPPGGAPRYDMIHMTLARYAEPAMLPADFAARIGAMPLDLVFRPDAVTVMGEAIYPSLAYDSIAVVPLHASETVA